MFKSAIIATTLAAATAISLTPDNWDSETAGKTVFIKFQAPWWGHCKKVSAQYSFIYIIFIVSLCFRGDWLFLFFFLFSSSLLQMKPDWDKLMSEINGRGGTTLVGDVDCTAAGKPLCDSNGVQGFPTIKFGDPSALEDYQGGRSYADILKHAETLKPSCSPSNLDLCDDDAKAEINKFMDMDDAKLDGLIEEKNDEIAAAEKHFETELEKLQNTYKKLSEEKDSSIAAVKDSGLGMMKAVKAAKAKAGKEEL